MAVRCVIVLDNSTRPTVDVRDKSPNSDVLTASRVGVIIGAIGRSHMREFVYGVLCGAAVMYLYVRLDPPKVLAYLNAHAEIHRQEFHDDRVTVRCSLPRHLLHHIQVPGVSVRPLNGKVE